MLGKIKRGFGRIREKTAFYSSILRGTRTVHIAGATATFRVSREDFLNVYGQFANERAVYETIVESLRPNDVFWDVGANIGTYSCLAADVVSTGTIVPFEPHPLNLARLKQNLQLNGNEDPVYEYALSDTDETQELAMWDSSMGTGLHNPETLDMEGRRTVDIKANPGDVLIDRHEIPPPTVLKIDVEGAELNVVRGLENALRRPECRLVICEIHAGSYGEEDETIIGGYGDSPSELEATLQGSGFDLNVVQQRERDYHLKAYK